MLATQSLNHHPYPPLPYSSASSYATGPLAAMSMYTTMQQHHHHPQYPFAAQPTHHHQQPQQQHVAAPPPPPRQYGAQGTSSAFSASANPDEDWTKISDLAERRRIQNRIAQRNYRKKLKRRLEDLERRAGSPDSAESQKPSPAAPAKSNTKRASTGGKVQKGSTSPQKQAAKPRQSSASPVRSPQPTIASTVTVAPQPTKPSTVPQMQFTPPMETTDEFIMGTQYDDGRELSRTPPPMYASNSPYAYPAPDDMLLNGYGGAGSQPYPSMVQGSEYPSYVPTAATAAPVMPPMTHFTDALNNNAIKRESYDSYTAGYGFYPGMDVGGSSPYESNPHTPPLSHTFDHSANCSESGFDYPTTPMSMPASPNMVQM